MTIPLWHEEAITANHDRMAFDCGEPHLNDFLHRHAIQNHTKGTSRTFLAISDDGKRSILGYYSLSIATLEYAQTPFAIRRRLSNKAVPMFRLCRLAVHRNNQGHGLGGQLLIAAGKRCLSAATNVGGIGMLIDAKSPTIADWYSSYGALRLPEKPLSLILTFHSIRTALEFRPLPN